MTTSSCYCESCPEAPSTINITQNTVELDGDSSGFGDEYFHADDVVAGTITLGHTPLTASAVQASLNGVLQGRDTGAPANNFTVSGAVITLGFAVGASDVVHVHYFWVD